MTSLLDAVFDKLWMDFLWFWMSFRGHFETYFSFVALWLSLCSKKSILTSVQKNNALFRFVALHGTSETTNFKFVSLKVRFETNTGSTFKIFQCTDAEICH